MLYNILPLSFFLILSITFLNSNENINVVDLKKVKLINQKLEATKKTKEDYEKKEDILIKPINKSTNIDENNNNDLNVNGSVNFDKDTKEVDKVKINFDRNF